MVEVRSGRAARAQVGSQIERYLTRRTPLQVVAELVLLHPRGGERTLAVGLEKRAYRRGIERSPQRLLVGRLEEHRVLRRPQDERGHAQLLFRLATQGKLKVRLGGRFRLVDAADAHRALGSRRTLGKLVLP